MPDQRIVVTSTTAAPQEVASAGIREDHLLQKPFSFSKLHSRIRPGKSNLIVGHELIVRIAKNGYGMIICSKHGLQQDDHAKTCSMNHKGRIEKITAYIIRH